MTLKYSPLSRGPLLNFHRASGATVQALDGWEIATCYPQPPGEHGNALVDLSHWSTHELNGSLAGRELLDLCGEEVPVRAIRVHGPRHCYRLTPSRVIVFGGSGLPSDALDVTGGWATFALFGADREAILNKVTALDLRESTLSQYACCQGPIFGVNTLFGRYPNYFLLHICPDSAEFLQEVLLDAGRDFELQPQGLEYYTTHTTASAGSRTAQVTAGAAS